MPRTFYGPFSEKDNTYANAGNANLGRYPLGTWLVLPDERGFRFTLNDGTVEIAGNVYQSVVPLAGHNNSAADVGRAVGDTAISATLDTTAAAVDIYAEGTVNVNGTPGSGYLYRIKRAYSAGDAHAAATSTGVLTVNLEADESVQAAITASTSDLTFSRNRFHQALLTAAPPTGKIVGVSPGVCAADRYYWSQTQGYASVAAEGTLLNGLPVQCSIATAGAVETTKRRMRTGGTTASVLTTAVTLRYLDQDGVTTTLFATGAPSTAATIDISAGIAYNAPNVGMCVDSVATTEFAVVDLTID